MRLFHVSDLRIFARKLIRSFAEFSPEEIDKEADVVSRLCQPGGNKHVVEVRRHGWLPHNPSYYYVDMEYCPQNLEYWIHGSGTPPEYTPHIDRASQVVRASKFSSAVKQSLTTDIENSGSTSGMA